MGLDSGKQKSCQTVGFTVKVVPALVIQSIAANLRCMNFVAVLLSDVREGMQRMKELHVIINSF